MGFLIRIIRDGGPVSRRSLPRILWDGISEAGTAKREPGGPWGARAQADGVMVVLKRVTLIRHTRNSCRSFEFIKWHTPIPGVMREGTANVRHVSPVPLPTYIILSLEGAVTE